MIEFAFVVMACLLAMAAFVLGFIGGMFYIPRRSRAVMQVAIKEADLTPEQQEKLAAAIEKAMRNTGVAA